MTIVKRSIFVLKQSPVPETTELRVTNCKCPATHTPIATLRLAVAWTQVPSTKSCRSMRGSKTTAVVPFAVVIAFVLAAAGTFVATIYLSGLLMQKMQHFQRYHEPRAQYSDLGKWQRQR